VLVGKEKKSFTIGLLEPVQGGKWRNDPGFSEHIILLYWVQERGREREREKKYIFWENYWYFPNISKPHWNSAISVISPPPIPNWWGYDTLPWHSGNWWLVLVGKYNPIVTS
jgi:hypothetical protein